MDREREIHSSEGVLRNSPEKESWTFGKKMRILVVMNFLMGVIFMLLSCSIAFHYWYEMVWMKRQLIVISDNIVSLNVNHERWLQNASVAGPRPPAEGDTWAPKAFDVNETAKTLYFKDVKNDVVDTKKKDSSKGNVSVCDWNTLQKELDVVQFNGGGQKEVNLGNQSLMGPWIRDEEASSKYSANKFELTGDYVTVKEDGLYLIYAQVVYLTRSPTCYYIWARQTGKHPRLLSTCATGDDSSNRPLSKSEMSCSLQTVARLYKEDIVNIAQREPNRTVLLRPGYSYFGFVKLKS
ncbi:unnamed protein product [Spodoptera littoralis]|uniref:THD domain-containing protein n=1 Tax=Spodoptera littoralis TaxID=7109 RepID=A0A9P0HWG5_SPOLI|nr:unnamed protein product [Spodoptera littoralis]CAH1636656.1 unnamed protein product [Spodoptera littoralis]